MSPKLFHYVLTIEIPGVGMATVNTVVELPAGTSRKRVYRRAVELAVENMGKKVGRDFTDRQPVTLFWSIEAEHLGGSQ